MDSLKLCKKTEDRQNTVVNVGSVRVGKDLTIIAGPCSVETPEQMLITAHAVKRAGANIMRGGAYKPRTSPYAFQGLGEQGLKLLKFASEETGLPVVTEIVDPRDIDLVCQYADMLQIGARNMQNFSLLTEAGKSGKPVLLKRGMNATIEEWLNCAEYILAEDNFNVVLCERGIRTFETYTRNTLDLSAVAAVKELSHLPVLVDPSHATGRVSMIEPMSLAAIATGADGIIVEVHCDPKHAVCDGAQSIGPDRFAGIISKLKLVRRCVTNPVIS